MEIEKYSKEYGVIENQGGFFTFEPKSLPFNNKKLLNWKIFNLVGEVSSKFGSLNNYISKLENIDLLLIPYFLKESLSSSIIEGTKSSLDELFLVENEKNLETADSQEVLNYKEALEFGLKEIEEKELDKNLIKEIHKILMSGVRGKNRSPGKYKEFPNWIGGIDIHEAEFVPPHPKSIDYLLTNLFDYLNSENEENLFLKIGIIHYQFETIHPFRDGNGRMGRLLIILFLCKKGLLIKPLIYISGFFEKYRKEYALRLQYVRENGELEKWIVFFLKGLKEQSEKSIIKIEKLNICKIKLEKQIKEKTNSIHTLNIINLLFKNPFLRVVDVKKYLNVGYPTAKFVVEKLLEEKIIKKKGNNKRNEEFVANEIYDIIIKE